MVFLRALSKLTLIGGAGGAAYLSNVVDISNELISKPTKPKETDIPESISSVEHIDIYEKHYGCSFVFVKSLSSKEAYKWRKFLALNKDNKNVAWQDLVVKAANKFREDCKKRRVISFSYKEPEFKMTVLNK